MLTDSGQDYLASYDGNGNLMALTKASDGTMAAMYEYSPYGKLLRAEGPYALEDPFRFSTKYRDKETGLYNYGLRYYDPEQGRFINRDPIEEKGGLNLYMFAGNDPVNNYDVLGMFTGGHADEYNYFQFEPLSIGSKDDVHEFAALQISGSSDRELFESDWMEIMQSELMISLDLEFGGRIDHPQGIGGGGPAAPDPNKKEAQKDKERPWWMQRLCDGAKSLLSANEKAGEWIADNTDLEESNASISYSTSGGLMIPLIPGSVFSGGGSGEFGINVTLDWDDPLDLFNIGIYGQAVPQLGVGAGVQLGIGNSVGVTENEPEAGGSYSFIAHVEGALAYKGGGSFDVDVELDKSTVLGLLSGESSFDLNALGNLYDGTSGSFSPRGVAGIAAYLAGGIGVQGNLTMPTLKDVVEDFVRLECQ